MSAAMGVFTSDSKTSSISGGKRAISVRATEVLLYKVQGWGEVLKTSNCSKPFSSSLLNWFDFISVMH